MVKDFFFLQPITVKPHKPFSLNAAAQKVEQRFEEKHDDGNRKEGGEPITINFSSSERNQRRKTNNNNGLASTSAFTVKIGRKEIVESLLSACMSPGCRYNINNNDVDDTRSNLPCTGENQIEESCCTGCKSIITRLQPSLSRVMICFSFHPDKGITRISVSSIAPSKYMVFLNMNQVYSNQNENMLYPCCGHDCFVHFNFIKRKDSQLEMDIIKNKCKNNSSISSLKRERSDGEDDNVEKVLDTTIPRCIKISSQHKSVCPTSTNSVVSATPTEAKKLRKWKGGLKVKHNDVLSFLSMKGVFDSNSNAYGIEKEYSGTMSPFAFQFRIVHQSSKTTTTTTEKNDVPKLEGEKTGVASSSSSKNSKESKAPLKNHNPKVPLSVPDISTKKVSSNEEEINNNDDEGEISQSPILSMPHFSENVGSYHQSNNQNSFLLYDGSIEKTNVSSRNNNSEDVTKRSENNILVSSMKIDSLISLQKHYHQRNKKFHSALLSALILQRPNADDDNKTIKNCEENSEQKIPRLLVGTYLSPESLVSKDVFSQNQSTYK